MWFRSPSRAVSLAPQLRIEFVAQTAVLWRQQLLTLTEEMQQPSAQHVDRLQMQGPVVKTSGVAAGGVQQINLVADSRVDAARSRPAAPAASAMLEHSIRQQTSKQQGPCPGLYDDVKFPPALGAQQEDIEHIHSQRIRQARHQKLLIMASEGLEECEIIVPELASPSMAATQEESTAVLCLQRRGRRGGNRRGRRSIKQLGVIGGIQPVTAVIPMLRLPGQTPIKRQPIQLTGFTLLVFEDSNSATFTHQPVSGFGSLGSMLPNQADYPAVKEVVVYNSHHGVYNSHHGVRAAAETVEFLTSLQLPQLLMATSLQTDLPAKPRAAALAGSPAWEHSVAMTAAAPLPLQLQHLQPSLGKLAPDPSLLLNTPSEPTNIPSGSVSPFSRPTGLPLGAIIAPSEPIRSSSGLEGLQIPITPQISSQPTDPRFPLSQLAALHSLSSKPSTLSTAEPGWTQHLGPLQPAGPSLTPDRYGACCRDLVSYCSHS